MKISYQWLKHHIGLEESPENVADLLTRSGLEVEKVETFDTIKGGLKGLVIGHVLTCEKHPDADKLSITTVAVGNGVIVPIVCGAPNVAAGQKVLVAKVGTTLYPLSGEPFKISKAKIRGTVSEGMICAEDEIGLGHSHDGILVLDTELPEGTPASAFFNIATDHIFEIGLTPNRADAASHLGVARDLKVLLQKDIKSWNSSLFSSDTTSLGVEVIIENAASCPRYCGLTISDLKVASSPSWLQNSLKSIGVAPINNIVDVTNYILHDLGQPLHAFDLGKIEGKKVIVKNVAEGTVFTTLDGVERKLSTDDLMICDAEKPMCIAGIFGGKNSGVSNGTTSIFLESAYFSPDTIRKSSLKHGLKTDASFRYERGTDPNIPLLALKKAAVMIQEIAGGNIHGLLDFYPQPIAHFQVTTSYNRINKLIGKEIKKEFVQKTLSALEIEIISDLDGTLLLSIPPYRVDVQREADIIEEILRIYGYDNIELGNYISAGYVAPFAENNSDKIQKILSELLVGNGFYEITTNSLTKSQYSAHLGISETDVKILNPLSETLDVMRQSLLFSGLEVVLHNVNRKQKDLKLYEFGKTYHWVNGKYVEKRRIALYLSGNEGAESWSEISVAVQYHDLKSVVSNMLAKAGVQKYETSISGNGQFQYAIDIVARTKTLVSLGVLNKKILKLADIKQEVFYADIDLELLEKIYSNKVVYQEISKFPEVRRDLSLVLDRQVTFDQIREIAYKQERKYMRSINVFDVYEGDKIPAGKKSYSVSFMLQDEEQTLTDEVIDKTMTKLMDAFEKEFGAIIRK